MFRTKRHFLLPQFFTPPKLTKSQHKNLSSSANDQKRYIWRKINKMEKLKIVWKALLQINQP